MGSRSLFVGLLLGLAACADDPPIRAVGLAPCGDPTTGGWDEAFVAPGVSGHPVRDEETFDGAHVDAIARLADGSLVAGGTFTTVVGEAYANIARWDGAAWHAMGDGLPPVRGMAVDDGVLWAIGDGGLARWDGASWEQITERQLDAIAAVPGGITVTGDVGGLAPGGRALAVWDGTTWSRRELSAESYDLDTIAATDDGFCVGGAIRTVTGGFAHDGVSCWSDATASWSALGPATAIPTALARGPDGRWWIGRPAAETAGAELAVLDGDVWHPMPGVLEGWTDPFFPQGDIAQIVFVDGEVVVGGTFHHFAGDGALIRFNALVSWNGTEWRPYPGADVLGFGSHVNALVHDGNRLHVGGRFVAAGGIAASNVATLAPDRARAWASDGIVGATGVGMLSVQGDATVAIGDISASDVAGAFAARFDGTWHEIARPAPEGGLGSAVMRSDGSIVTSSSLGVYEWRDGAWSRIMLPSLAGSPLAIDDDDRIYLRADSREVIRLDGADHRSLGTVPGQVTRLEVLDDTVIAFVENEITFVGSIYVWRDATWTELEGVPDRYDRAVVVPALGLVVTAPDGVHVWDGTGWRMLSTEAHTGPLAACDRGLVAASIESHEGPATLWFFDGAGWHELGRDERPMWGAVLAVGTDGIYVQPFNGAIAAPAMARWRY